LAPGDLAGLGIRVRAVLKRHASEAGLTLRDIDDFVEYLCGRSSLVQIYFRWRPAFRDPNDDRILEVAVRKCAPVVTYNTKGFTGAERFGIH
jgi:predicted nucleic acid-binding protein